MSKPASCPPPVEWSATGAELSDDAITALASLLLDLAEADDADYADQERGRCAETT